MASVEWLTVLAVLAACILGVMPESCPNYVYNSGYYYYQGYKSCSNGCCGSYPDYYCCVLSSAAIAGIVLGAIVLVCLAVFLISYCLKKKSETGRVVRPVQPATHNTTVVYTGGSGQYPVHNPPQFMPAPPPYKRSDPPPAYSEAGGPPSHFGSYGTTPAPPYSSLTMTSGYHGYGQGSSFGTTPAPPYAPSTSSSAATPAGIRFHGYGQGQGWSAPDEPSLGDRGSVQPTGGEFPYGRGQHR